jgi:hypothetical protein
MAHDLDQADELPFVRRQLRVVWCNLAAEEGYRADVLMKHQTRIPTHRTRQRRHDRKPGAAGLALGSKLSAGRGTLAPPWRST